MDSNPLVPELKVSDFAKSLQFYTRLGFRIEFERPEFKFAFLSLEGSQLMIEESGESDWTTGNLEYPFGRGIHLQIRVASVQNILDMLNGHPLFVEPHEKWYRQEHVLVGHRQFLVQDPDGYLLRFFEYLGEKQLSQ